MAEIMVALGQTAEARWMLREHNVPEATIDAVCTYVPKRGLIDKLRSLNHQRRVDGKLHYDGRKVQRLLRKFLPT
jgi:hypothetical protein